MPTWRQYLRFWIPSNIKAQNFFLPKLDTDQAICDAFSTFFIRKIDNIMIKIHATVKSKSISSSSLSLPSYLPPPLHHFQPTDETELSKIILKGPLKVMLIRCTSNITAEKNNYCSASDPLWHYQQVDDDRCISCISQNSRRYTPHKENITWPGCDKKKYRPVSNWAGWITQTPSLVVWDKLIWIVSNTSRAVQPDDYISWLYLYELTLYRPQSVTKRCSCIWRYRKLGPSIVEWSANWNSIFPISNNIK